MASEVTMKDLQSLQGYVNKQDEDLRKQLTGLKKDIEKLSGLQKAIDQLTLDAKATDGSFKLLPHTLGISEMTAKIAALESKVKGLSR